VGCFPAERAQLAGARYEAGGWMPRGSVGPRLSARQYQS